MTVPRDVQDLFADLVHRFERESLDRETAAAQADPLAHKLSKVMAGKRGLDYRYFSAGQDGRGHWVRFCYSTHRNVAGFYLGWREVSSKRQTKRDQWVSRRVRRRVKEIAQRRSAAFRKKRARPVQEAVRDLAAGWHEPE